VSVLQNLPFFQKKGPTTIFILSYRSNNEFVANTILRSVLNYIDKNYYFITNAKDIAILSPENEGGFSWLAINYVKGILQLNAVCAQFNLNLNLVSSMKRVFSYAGNNIN
jgi:Golgi nucleoside diphosphatase